MWKRVMIILLVVIKVEIARTQERIVAGGDN